MFDPKSASWTFNGNQLVEPMNVSGAEIGSHEIRYFSKVKYFNHHQLNRSLDHVSYIYYIFIYICDKNVSYTSKCP